MIGFIIAKTEVKGKRTENQTKMQLFMTKFEM